MKIRYYLLLAIVMFLGAVTGSDVFARMTIADEGFHQAISEHLHYFSLEIVGNIILFAPFGGSALICGMANRQAKTRSVAIIFSISIAILTYFYFTGFQAAQRAVLEMKWTAAALSVGLLPFFIGVPVLVTVAIAAGITARVDRRPLA